jgi:hypothetical protein
MNEIARTTTTGFAMAMDTIIGKSIKTMVPAGPGVRC